MRFADCACFFERLSLSATFHPSDTIMMDLPVAFVPSVPSLCSSIPITAGAGVGAHLSSPCCPFNAPTHLVSPPSSNSNSRRRRASLAASTNDASASGTNNSNGSGIKGAGLYVHIPYCRRRCRYCDFAIVPIGAAGAASVEGCDDKFVHVSSDGADDSPFRRSSSSSGSRAVDGFRKMDDAYRNALLTELDLIRQTSSRSGMSTDDSGRIPLRSIYFGGGTPSLAPSSTLRSILSAIVDPDNGPFYIPGCNGDTRDPAIEITIEMDPGTFTEAKLVELRDAGFNRISLGVQSFDDDILRSIGRVHRRADVFASIDMIRRVFCDDNGSDNDSESSKNTFSYSVDLISGLPGLSLAKWAETLETAVRLHPMPDHLSLYDLQVEEGTVFGKWYRYSSGEDDDDNSNSVVEDDERNALARTRSVPSVDVDASNDVPSLPSPGECAYMYRYASGYLRSKGYEHYEISSYARPGKRSEHNQIYWEIGSNWYAIGLGSTSSISGNRFARPRSMADYIEWVRQQEELIKNDGGSPRWLVADDDASDSDDVEDSDSDSLADVVLTKLRTKEGLCLNWVRRDVVDGEAKVEAIIRGSELALSMNLAKRDTAGKDHDFLRLQDPDGFLFSNNIISQIFVELDELE